MTDPLPSIFIPGTAQTAGSKRAFVRAGRAIVTDDNPNSRAWKERVAYFARQAWPHPPLDEPLVVSFVFTLARPGYHFGKRAGVAYLKPNAPSWHSSRPDALKLARGCEDALSGVVYADDSLIAEEHLRKVYGPQPGVAIVIRRALEPTPLELAAAMRSA